MSTTDTRAKGAASRVATLTLTIGSTAYVVRPLEAPYGFTAFELVKADGTSYVVSRDGGGGLECECGDYVWRHEGQDTRGCKHCRALRALGVL